jgi:hypothetical protein
MSPIGLEIDHCKDQFQPMSGQSRSVVAHERNKQTEENLTYLQVSPLGGNYEYLAAYLLIEIPLTGPAHWG